MPRPRQITDEQIDAAARATFVEHGPAAPVSMVAKRLGVTHAALLQRAGSKEQLLLRSLTPSAPEVARALDEMPPSRGQDEHLAALLTQLLSFHERMLPGLMVLRAGGLPTLPPGTAEPPPVMFRRRLAAWLARTGRVAKRRAEALANALLGAIEARCFNGYLGGKAFAPGDAARFVEELVSGLLPELAKPVCDGVEHGKPENPRHMRTR